MIKKIFSFFLLAMLLVGSFSFNQASAQENLPEGCTTTSGYSITTGVPCTSITGTTSTSTGTIVSDFPDGCSSAIGYSVTTGNPCNGSSNSPIIGFLPGCSSALGYSITNGQPCSGSSVALQYLGGCSSIYGYSIETGSPCNGTAVATIAPGTGIPTTPGLPTTGAGGEALANTFILLASLLGLTLGLVFLTKKPNPTFSRK